MAKSPALVPVKTTLVKLTATVPEFVNVTVSGVPVLPTATCCQVTVEGDAVAEPGGGGACAPEPESEICCGLPVPVSVKVNRAVRVPSAVGAKRTVAVQAADAARVVPQFVCETEKSPELAPAIATPVMLMLVEPVLLRVAVCEAPVCPIKTFPQLRVDGYAAALAVPVEVELAFNADEQPVSDPMKAADRTTAAMAFARFSRRRWHGNGKRNREQGQLIQGLGRQFKTQRLAAGEGERNTGRKES